MSGTGVPGPPEPAGTFSISEKNSMLGMTHNATWAPSGQVRRGRRRSANRETGRRALASSDLRSPSREAITLSRDGGEKGELAFLTAMLSRCATTSSTCITSQYLWCMSNRLTL